MNTVGKLKMKAFFPEQADLFGLYMVDIECGIEAPFTDAWRAAIDTFIYDYNVSFSHAKDLSSKRQCFMTLLAAVRSATILRICQTEVSDKDKSEQLVSVGLAFIKAMMFFNKKTKTELTTPTYLGGKCIGETYLN